MYINNLKNANISARYCVYADDTCLLYKSKNQFDLNNEINEDLLKFNEWLIGNKFVINVKKTNYIIFKSTKKVDINLELFVDGEEISRVRSIKYLGVMLDERWSWKEHYLMISNKISKLVGTIRRCPRLSIKLAKMVDNSYILSHIRYNLTIWSQCTKYVLNNVQILMKRCLKILFNLPLRFSSNELYKVTETLSLEKIMFFDNCKLMFKIKNNLVKNNIELLKNSDFHNYNTRNKKQIRTPFAKTKILNNSTYHKCIKNFNTLPKSIQEIANYNFFCQKLKKFVKNL